MNDFKLELETAISIAKESGQIMLKYFDDDQSVETKDDNSLVTIADKIINSLVISSLSKIFPDDGVIGEEESNSGYGNGRKWFCDPIDGTHGFIWGVPTAMFSLALVIDGIPIVGVAYDPFLNKMYTGIRSERSYCNDKVLSVSNLSLKTGILAVSSSIRSFQKTKHIQKMINDNLRLASINGAVYKSCLVAKGKLVGYVEHGVNTYDIAAVHVITTGAGGKITSIEGNDLDYSKPFRGAIVSNGIVHDEIVKYCS